MTRPSRGPNYYPSPGAYPAYSFAPVRSDDSRGRVGRHLSTAVVVLGLATYFVSFGPMSEVARAGWEVWFPVLAAVIAALTLLPKRAPRNWIVVPLAVAGFLVALSTWIGADNAGWALVVIVALNAVQMVAAVAAVLIDAGVGDEDDDDVAPGYAAYPYYAAYQADAAQQRRAPTHTATAQAHGAGAAEAQAQQSYEAWYEAMQARYAQYVDYLQHQPSAGESASVSPDPGIAGAGRGAAPSVRRDAEPPQGETSPP